MGNKILIICMLLFFKHCEGIEYNGWHEIENNSSYDIEMTVMKTDTNGVYKAYDNFTIEKGSVYSYHHLTKELRKITLEGYMVKFDDGATVLYNSDNNCGHNPARWEDYEWKFYEYSQFATFSFTDADYEYALEHPYSKAE